MSAPDTRLASAVVRRHLEHARPSVAQVLAALARGEQPVTIPHMPLVERVEQIKQRALEAGAREAAWLLYMGARSCLFEIDDYARTIEAQGSPAGKPDQFRSRYVSLAGRVTSLATSPMPRWTQTGISSVPSQLATESLDIADAVLPGWTWLLLSRGMVEMASGRWESALELMNRVISLRDNDSLRAAAIRNALQCTVELGQPNRLARLVDELASIEGQAKAAAAFAMSISAAAFDRIAFEDNLAKFVEAPSGTSDGYWARFAMANLHDWARGVGIDRETLVARLGEMS